MQGPSLVHQPPGLVVSSSATRTDLPQIKLPSFATRRAACTHLTMDRLYGNFKCNVCNRSSEFGWVYTCTQDDEDVMGAIGGEIVDSPGRSHPGSAGSAGLESETHIGSHTCPDPNEGDSPVSMGMLTSSVSPWIEKAISDGKYTPEQIVILRAQKQEVYDVAKAAVERFEKDQQDSSPPPQMESTSESIDANPHLPFPLIHEVQNRPKPDISNEKQSKESKPKMFPHCCFRGCQLCRPTWRDRTWQCFEHVLGSKASVSIQALDAGNRPFASASVMQKIGLRQGPRRPQLRRFDSRVLYSMDDEGRLNFKSRGYGTSLEVSDSSESSDIADASAEPESKGFRESMKRAFREMFAARSRAGRKRKRRGSIPDENPQEFDMGLWQEMNDELQDEASNVPLPVKDSIDTLTTQMEETDIGGVAVTEEAAEMKSADIIMSV